MDCRRVSVARPHEGSGLRAVLTGQHQAAPVAPVSTAPGSSCHSVVQSAWVAPGLRLDHLRASCNVISFRRSRPRQLSRLVQGTGTPASPEAGMNDPKGLLRGHLSPYEPDDTDTVTWSSSFFTEKLIKRTLESSGHRPC